MKFKILPVLLAIITGAAVFTACSSAPEKKPAHDAVNRVYPEGEGKYYSPSTAAAEEPSTAAETTQTTTTAATAKPTKPKATTATTKPTTSPTQPSTIQGNVPKDNITPANVNPNISSIQGRVAADIAALEVKSLALSEKNLTLEVGEVKNLTLKFTPDNALVKTVTMQVSNGNISASVSGTNVTVKGMKAGTATLTIASLNGHKATCDITVKRKEQVITDDTPLPHSELCTAENAARWCAAVQARLEELGMKYNSALNGNTVELVTQTFDDMSYNTAKSVLLTAAETELSKQIEGDWSEYEFNCTSQLNDSSEYLIIIVANKIEEE